MKENRPLQAVVYATYKSGSTALFQAIRSRMTGDVLEALAARLQTKLEHPTSTSLLEVFAHPFSREFLDDWMSTNYGRLTTAIEAGAVVVRYEDLVAGRLGELWMAMGLPAESTETDVRWPHVPRTKRAGNWRQWLTEEDAAWLRGIVDPVLAQWPWMSKDWNLDASPELSVSESIDCIRRTVNLRRAQAHLKAW